MKKREPAEKRTAGALAAAFAVLCASLAAVFRVDAVQRREQAAETDALEAVGFLCGSRDRTEAVTVTEDPYGNYWDVFLPGKVTEGDGVHLVCDRAFSVEIEETIYRNGDILPVRAAGEEIPARIAGTGGEDRKGVFRFYEADGIPSVFLSTISDDAEEAMEESKGHDESAVCRIAEADGSAGSGGMCRMRVHGNTSWFEEKKSYNLHFADPVSLLGMSAQKKWVLLGNQTDNSSLENAVMQTLAARIGEKFCPEWRYVSVFLNGEYRGLYLLIQKIDISGGTVRIADLEKENSRLKEGENPENISGGYLMELMGELSWESAPRRFETPNRYIEVKSPKNATAEEVNDISDLVNRAETALYTDSGNGGSWMNLYDEESWIIQFLLQEVSFNEDTELGSQFFYVDRDEEKLYGGPAWDFDKSLRLPTANESMTYVIRSLHVDALHDDGKVQGGKLWLQQMDTDPAFHEDMKKFYLEKAGPALAAILEEEVPEWRTSIQASLLADCIRWGMDYESVLAAGDRAVDTFGQRGQFLTRFYENEDAYAVVRFVIEDGRYDLLVPVRRGESIHEDVMPLVNDSMNWMQEDGEPFTAETVVNGDMTVTHF